MEKPTKQYLSHKETSEFLQISSGTLYGKTSRKEIPVHKFRGGRKNFYKLSELEELLEPVK